MGAELSLEELRRKLGDSGRLLRVGGSLVAPPPPPLGAGEGKMGGLLAEVNVVGDRTEPGDSGCNNCVVKAVGRQSMRDEESKKESLTLIMGKQNWMHAT